MGCTHVVLKNTHSNGRWKKEGVVTTNDRRRAVAYRETIATTRDAVEEDNFETDDRGKKGE